MTLVLNIVALAILAGLVWLAVRGQRDEQAGEDRR
jgi:hypothetical protein